MFSKITKEQFGKIVRAAIYVGVSAMLDYLISISTGSTFGVWTAPINVALVTFKQAITKG